MSCPVTLVFFEPVARRQVMKGERFQRILKIKKYYIKPRNNAKYEKNRMRKQLAQEVELAGNILGELSSPLNRITVKMRIAPTKKAPLIALT